MRFRIRTGEFTMDESDSESKIVVLDNKKGGIFMKKLEEMTMEELWQLFPVVLKEYNPDYILWYEEERKNIEKRIGKENIFRIRHIGSTSVPGLLSKPTVDILLELVPEAEQEKIVSSLKEEWILMSESEKPKKFVFNKGYTPAGFAEKVFHLHVRCAGDWDELYFCDYLREYPAVAEEYGALKKSLLKKFEHDSDGYTAAKGDFVREYTKKARSLYGGRYLPEAKNNFSEACSLMERLFSKDCIFVMATVEEGGKADARSVDIYYSEGAFYVVTHRATGKVRQTEAFPHVCFCSGEFRFYAVAENIGHPLEAQNARIRSLLTNAFHAWYFRHNDENDEGMCYLRARLENGFFHFGGTGYRVDFLHERAEKFPFQSDIVLPTIE